MGGFGSILGLAFEITADPDHAIAAIQLFEDQVATSIGASTKGFAQFKDAAGAAARDLAFLGAGAVGAATGFLALAEHAAEAGNAIYGAAQKTGMSAQALSGVMALAKETGHSFEGLTMSFARGARNLAEAADTGKGALTDLFTQTQLQALKLKPVDEQMHIVLNRIFAMTNAGERNRELQALLGRGWMENVGILKMLATEGYEPAIEKAKQFGVFFDAKAAAEAHTFMKEMDTLKAEFSGMALSLGKEFMPQAEMFLAWLHTAKTDAEVFGLRLLALAGAVPTLGLSLGLLHNATKLESAAIQEQTNWLVELRKQMKAAGDSAKDLAASLPGASEGGAKPAAAKSAAPKQTEDAILGATHAVSEAITSFALWKLEQDKDTVATLSLQHALVGIQGTFSQEDVQVQKATKQITELAKAENLAKTAMDGLVASFDNAGGKASAFSQKTFQAAQALAEMAEKAQEASDKGENVDPKQQVAGMVQIAAAAILTYKQRAIVESVYYAAKSLAAFAAQDYLAGAEFAGASGLFAEAAGTASKTSSGAGGPGGNQSSYGGSPGSGGGSGPGGGGSGGSGSRGPTVILNQYGPMVGSMADLAKAMVPVLNQLGTSGQVRLTAYNALTNGAKQT